MPSRPAPDSGGFIAALAQANTGKPYLGDPAVVDDLLRLFAFDMTQRDAQVGRGELTQDAANAAALAHCKHLARLLTGQDPGYAATPFNSPDQIGGYIARRLGIGDEGADAVEHGAILFAGDINKGLQLAHDGNPDWETAIGGALEDYGQLFLGMPPYEEPD